MAQPTRQSRHDIGTRLQALTLLEIKVPIATITEITGISKSSITLLRRNAIARGYDPTKSKRLVLAYVEDASRSGRPTKVAEEVEKKVVTVISKNSTTRQLSTKGIAHLVNTSPDIVNMISVRTV
jgi:hypothetical protein